MSSGEEQQRRGPNWRALFRSADETSSDATGETKRQRGRDLERILNGALSDAGLSPRTSYRPQGEEIDGSFVLSGRTFLLEAKWTAEALPASSIYQFRGKVEGKLVGTVGVFVSMAGFSKDAVDALVAGKIINVLLTDGDDIRALVDGKIDLESALNLKLRAAAETGTPMYPLVAAVEGTHSMPASLSTTVIVEGRFDERLINALPEALGQPDRKLTVLPAGGALNLAPLANAVASNTTGMVVIIADGDGQPSEVRRRVAQGLHEYSDSPHRVFVLEPTLEAAAGALEGYAEGRRKVLMSDRALLNQQLLAADLPVRAKDNSELRSLLSALGFEL